SFGRFTIRKFRKNVCAMKRLAARDFEDILQCALPVFESVPWPERRHRQVILDMLFELANWHALAKLRVHTDDTLHFLEAATVSLGNTLRKFRADVCPHYDTRELPLETAARGRRAVTRLVTQAASSGGQTSSANVPSKSLRKELNLVIYKFHSLGDYVKTIKEHGTTDNFTSQGVSGALFSF
ncbi:hypothetical protein CONPUDRAFT_65816, partial [Coniophora puteana RWD-64-598 SS2]